MSSAQLNAQAIADGQLSNNDVDVLVELATWQFQREQKLSSDGAFGPGTQAKFTSDRSSSPVTPLCGLPKLASRAQTYNRKRLDAKDIAPEQWELLLELGARAFQSLKGLKVDGFIGPITRAALRQSLHGFAATDDLVFGVDLSHHQPAPSDYAAFVKAGNIAFGYARASYGTHGDDASLETHFQGLKRGGAKVGVYMFCLMNQDPEASAEHLVKKAESVGWDPHSDHPIWADIEQPPAKSDAYAVHAAMTPAQRTEWIAKFLAKSESLTGRPTGIYSGPGYWNEAIASDAFGTRPYWAARYPTTQLQPDPRTLLHSQPGDTTGWQRGFTIWQYAGNNGRVTGYAHAVDSNIMRRCDLRGLTGIPQSSDASASSRVA